MNRNKVVVMLDNGHGCDTSGKRSPKLDDELKNKYGVDRLYEYRYVRDIVSDLILRLGMNGIEVFDVVPEENDVPLHERVRRANEKYSQLKYVGKTAIYVSVHVNAKGNGKEWENATGWSAFTSKGQTQGDKVADKLYEAAHEILDPIRKKVRMDNSDGDEDWEENYYVLKNTKCPAVLTENFFMDNRKDVDWLLSDGGREAIAQIHVNGILKYIDEL